MERLYKQFLEHRREGHYLSKDQKLDLMKDALLVEGDSSFAAKGPLPAFYA